MLTVTDFGNSPSPIAAIGPAAEFNSIRFPFRPVIVAEIKFTEWTSGGVLRHAEFAGLIG